MYKLSDFTISKLKLMQKKEKCITFNNLDLNTQI